ncbi:MAG: HU family DNA-binding protein [Mycoplasmoidaceae bacterium]
MGKKLVLDSNMRPLTKNQIIKLISDNANISIPVIKDIFDDFQKLMFAELDRCLEFKLLDIGKIKVKRSNPRIGVNPSTGQKVEIAAKTKLKFTFSKNCKVFAETLYI